MNASFLNEVISLCVMGVLCLEGESAKLMEIHHHDNIQNLTCRKLICTIENW